MGLDARSVIQEANLAALALLGLAPAQVAGRSFLTLVARGSQERFAEFLNRVRANDTVGLLDVELRVATGRPLHVQLLASGRSFMHLEGGLIQLALVDVTERNGVEAGVRSRALQLAAVTELATANVTPPELQAAAVDLVARTLCVEFCEVLQLLPDRNSLKLTAGLGWRPGVAGGAGSASGWSRRRATP